MRGSVMIGLLLAACGAEVDDRPETVEYITVGVLAPSCAAAQCHSSFRAVSGYSFSTVAESRESLKQIVVPADPDTSLLMIVLTRSVDRMPIKI